MAQNSILDKELKSLTLFYQLNYHDFILLDCLPLFLCFLISSIRICSLELGESLKLKLFCKQKVGRGHGGPHSIWPFQYHSYLLNI